MLVMFSALAIWFYLDAATGYRHKNEVFYLHRVFEQADKDFSRMNAQGTLTPQAWKKYAEQQSVMFPPGCPLPARLKLPLPWPAILHDYQRMKPLQWNLLWREYSKTRRLDANPKEEPFSARNIQDQWVVCAICSALAVGAAFFLLRTLARSISADGEAITTQQGRRVPYTELKSLDLRKWETKGLAFLDYAGPAGKGRIRIDGLTYGGFRQENSEPAERLMRLIRSRFSGELIDYVPLRAADLVTEGESKPT